METEDWDRFPSVLMIMLCMRCGLGGTEKRCGRVFEMLVTQTGADHKLLISRSLLELLQSVGILVGYDDHLIVLDPPGVGLLDVLWYAWQCWVAIRRYKPNVVHPLLTGIYLSLPAMLANPRVGWVVSAYSNLFEPRSAYGQD